MESRRREAECATLWCAHLRSPVPVAVTCTRCLHAVVNPWALTLSSMLCQVGNRCVGLYKKGSHRPLYSSVVCSLPYHSYMQVLHIRLAHQAECQQDLCKTACMSFVDREGVSDLGRARASLWSLSRVHVARQVCGARGGGDAAKQGVFLVIRKDSVWMLACESAKERNTAIRVIKCCAQGVDVHLTGPS